MADAFFISLLRSLRGTLERPAEYVTQDAPYMARVVADARGLFDHLGNPRQAPDLSRESEGTRPLAQSRVDLLDLSLTQPWPAACTTGALQSLSAGILPGLIPSTHTLARDTELLRDVCLRLAGSKHVRRAKAPLSQESKSSL